ncbi:MAG TPA: NUDIX domain-containing protein [Panacibacter sp.]|nr:NUDIX domain-containing protein [Panacibacter sp.]HNP43334.1 NUDIX domain-containing protein [Panacibacter sp.]
MVEFKSANDLRLRGGKYFMAGISIDCVIFGFHDGQLKLLLSTVANVGDWALPAGFIYKDEHIDDSAKRILKERTGLEDIFLQQFYVFGDPNRCDNNITKNAFEKLQITPPNNNWLLGRFLTVGYYALVDFAAVNPSPDYFSDQYAWHDIHQLPNMAMDHGAIVQQALLTLRIHLRYQPVGYSLLPEKFTMPELQKLYETILDQKLDRRNFQRKMIGYGILKRLKQRREGVAHKAPYLYSFDLRKYHKALKEGFQTSW